MPRGKQRTVRKSVMTEEEELINNNMDLLLKDFDKGVESGLKRIKSETEAAGKNIKSFFKIEMMKLNPKVINSNLQDFLVKHEGERVVPMINSEAMSATLMGSVESTLSQVKSTIKSTSKRKRGVTASAVKENTEPGSVRRSGRRNNNSVAETPAPANRPAHPPSYATPFITPKFNPKTPLSRTVSRNARPNEVLMSMSGSPVMPINMKTKVAKAVAENTALIPLGDNQALNLPLSAENLVESVDGHDLDEDQLERLRTLHKTLGSILKI